MPKRPERLDKHIDQQGQDLMATIDRVDAGRKAKPFDHKLGGEVVRLFDHDPPMLLQVDLSPDGRLICTGLLIGWQLNGTEPAEITARDVHGIRLGEVLSSLPVPGSIASAPLPARPRHPGRSGHSDDHYRMVADLYRSALRTSPRSPMQRLAKDLHVGPATAYRWRDEAAARGFLELRTRVRRGPSAQTTTSRKKGKR